MSYSFISVPKDSLSGLVEHLSLLLQQLLALEVRGGLHSPGQYRYVCIGICLRIIFPVSEIVVKL